VKHIVITGATGFVGEHIVRFLARQSCYAVTAVVRKVPEHAEAGVDYRVCEDILQLSELNMTSSVDTLIHTAGLAHVSHDNTDAALYDDINNTACDSVAQAAIKWQARQIIHFSTSKVFNEDFEYQPLHEASPTAPATAYARSKLAGESRFTETAGRQGVRVLLLRPPVIYGSNVKANMALLVKVVSRLPWLPFRALSAPRSALGIRNLLDFVQCVLEREPETPFASEVFVLADAEASATRDLCEAMAKAMNLKRVVFYVPRALLQLGAILVGKRSAFNTMSQPFVLQGQNGFKYYRWTPPYTLQQELNNWLRG
jgi:nucleoside-diphosphate-sugar epimerase